MSGLQPSFQNNYKANGDWGTGHHLANRARSSENEYSYPWRANGPKESTLQGVPISLSHAWPNLHHLEIFRQLVPQGLEGE